MNVKEEDAFLEQAIINGYTRNVKRVVSTIRAREADVLSVFFTPHAFEELEKLPEVIWKALFHGLRSASTATLLELLGDTAALALIHRYCRESLEFDKPLAELYTTLRSLAPEYHTPYFKKVWNQFSGHLVADAADRAELAILRRLIEELPTETGLQVSHDFYHEMALRRVMFDSKLEILKYLIEESPKFTGKKKSFLLQTTSSLTNALRYCDDDTFAYLVHESWRYTETPIDSNPEQFTTAVYLNLGQLQVTSISETRLSCLDTVHLRMLLDLSASPPQDSIPLQPAVEAALQDRLHILERLAPLEQEEQLQLRTVEEQFQKLRQEVETELRELRAAYRKTAQKQQVKSELSGLSSLEKIIFQPNEFLGAQTDAAVSELERLESIDRKALQHAFLAKKNEFAQSTVVKHAVQHGFAMTLEDFQKLIATSQTRTRSL